MTHPCLSRRIEPIHLLRGEFLTWETERNQKKSKIQWHFQTEDANERLISPHPAVIVDSSNRIGSYTKYRRYSALVPLIHFSLIWSLKDFLIVSRSKNSFHNLSFYNNTKSINFFIKCRSPNYISTGSKHFRQSATDNPR